ncbi:MAG: hypothetical protein FVQ83_04545 [Chloroflexi bacterium]|nr:hypothetical protein [Chloroflexota bacterium]
MKTIKPVLLITLLTLLLAACVRPAPTVLPPSDAMTQAAVSQPTAFMAVASNTPVQIDPAAPPEASATQPSAPDPDPTGTAAPVDGNTPIPTNTSDVIPTNTSAFSPTPTLEGLDPLIAFGPAQIADYFQTNSNWLSPSNALPDTDNIRLMIQNDEMLVTGKRPLFDTWYFTWPTRTDFYLEMIVDSDQCGGKDAYGMILRGSASGDPSHGYIFAFSCDGHFLFRRLDSSDPYSASELLIWTESEHIRGGSDQINVMGILAEGDTFTLYANGQQIAVQFDDFYSFGRYGVFVSSAQNQGYTYRVKQILLWDLD